VKCFLKQPDNDIIYIKARCTHGADDMVITNAHRILIVKLEVKRQLGKYTHTHTHTHTLRNTK